MVKVTVIIPTYNEIENIDSILKAVRSSVPDAELLVVDDNSPDGTGNLAEQLGHENQKIHVMHREQKQGLGKAYLAGIQWGLAQGFEYMVQMDADGSHRSVDLPALLAKANLAGLVIGSRWIPGGEVHNWPWYRKAISRFGNFYAAKMLGSAIGDLTAGFRVYGRDLLLELPLGQVAAQGYGFQVEMTKNVIALRRPITEVPIHFVERENGTSKMTIDIVLEAFTLATKWGIERLFRR